MHCTQQNTLHCTVLNKINFTALYSTKYTSLHCTLQNTLHCTVLYKIPHFLDPYGLVPVLKPGILSEECILLEQADRTCVLQNFPQKCERAEIFSSSKTCLLMLPKYPNNQNRKKQK